MQATALQQQQQQQQQQQRSSPSHDQQYYQQQANKNRNPMTQPIPDMQRQNVKQEPRQHGKDQQQPKPVDPTKNQIKPQQQHNSGNNSGNLYPTNENQQRMSSGSRQPPYQQQLLNYNQAMASRKGNHPQQPQPEHASVHHLKHPTTESAFRLTDDQCGPMVEGQELSSPPKQHKSIFSPEWNDSVNVVPQRPANNGLNIKTNRDSPKKHRSETPKKDKRNDLITGQLGNKVPSHSDKRGNDAKPGMPAMTVPQQNLPFDATSTIAKHLNAGLKRMLPDDTFKQENGIDFREAKQRKLDVIQPLSPSFSLDCIESYEPSATLPQQLFEIPMLPTQIKLEVGSEHGQRIKSEKKKKKDKHKHKDKDKTKDREERKKHKKDKDRQKDRERSADLPAVDGHNPLKIMIPRDKLISTQDPAPGGFKITIPRDRIKPEPVPPPASLKIKISKDLIGDYASGQQHNAVESNSNSHSHSSKKKDKDRDRDKSKNSKHLEFTKQKGSGSNGSNSNGGNATVTSANSSNSRTQSSNSNKVCLAP